MRGSEDQQLKQDFVAAYYECWLYSLDAVIKLLTRFLRRLHVEPTGDEPPEALLGLMVLEVRRDLLARGATRKTGLTEDDFEVFGVARR